jgi:hypothetical protein
MPRDQFSRLQVETQEIGLITLLAGKFSDTIQYLISHKVFVIPKPNFKPKASLKTIQKTLPENWGVSETFEGRFLYDYSNPGPALEFTSWEHPSPSFDPYIINDEDNQDIMEVQLQFEALSYTWGSPKDPEISYVEVIDEKQHSTSFTLYRLARILPHSQYQCIETQFGPSLTLALPMRYSVISSTSTIFQTGKPRTHTK